MAIQAISGVVRLLRTFLSKVSNADNGDRRCGGHRTLGRTLTHALNFPAGLVHRFQPVKQPKLLNSFSVMVEIAVSNLSSILLYLQRQLEVLAVGV